MRSAALDLLASWNPDKYQPTFIRLATEQSYLVAGSAVMGLVAAGQDLVDAELIEQFSEDENLRMTIPVAEFYIKQNVSGKGKWFLDRLSTYSGENLYFFMGYFSEYFARHPEEGKDKAVSVLLALMKDESKNYMRMGAFQALLGFADDKAVIGEIVRVADMESDSDLKNYYNYFLEALKEEN